MGALRTTDRTDAKPCLVVGGRSLLVRGVRGVPMGRVAAVAPVWRVAVGRPGPIVWRARVRAQYAAGLLVPPEVHVDAHVGDAIAVLHLEAEGFGLLPWATVGPPEAVPLFTAGSSLRMLWSVADRPDLDQVSVEVVRELRAGRLVPPSSARDRRVAVGLDFATAFGSITEGAATVGLSMTRFRRLVREQAGTSPTRLRTWRRLRHALELLGEHDLAGAAAIAGFSDQAHLTRTCTRFIGTSPGRLRNTVHPPARSEQGRRPSPGNFETPRGPQRDPVAEILERCGLCVAPDGGDPPTSS